MLITMSVFVRNRHRHITYYEAQKKKKKAADKHKKVKKGFVQGGGNVGG